MTVGCFSSKDRELPGACRPSSLRETQYYSTLQLKHGEVKCRSNVEATATAGTCYLILACYISFSLLSRGAPVWVTRTVGIFFLYLWHRYLSFIIDPAHHTIMQLRYRYVAMYRCPRKKTSLGKSLAESHAYNPIRDWGDAGRARKVSPRVSPKVSPRVSARLLVRLSAKLLVRLFALAKRLPRVSDPIMCTALRKTLSETRFVTRVLFGH